jgi:membrane protein implicated in regulation of membrane protease activity
MTLTTEVGIAFLVLGGLLVVVEMHTVTIYLLAEALACFAGGAVAVTGGGLDVTLGVFTVVTLLSLPVAHWVRRKLRNREAEEVTRDDVGRSATILSAEAGKIRASYRGTVWDARLEESTDASPHPGETYRISAREGNVLVLALPVTHAGQSGG